MSKLVNKSDSTMVVIEDKKPLIDAETTTVVAKPDMSEKAKALIKRQELLAELEKIEAEHGTTPTDPAELRPFVVNLAPHSQGYIDYNGIRYYQGQIYQVDFDLYCSLSEIQGNTHRHEKTLKEPENQYRKQSNRRL
jgi:hypothetical protein